MIERYTLPEMGRIWTLENKFQKWLDVEIAACEAMAELGQIPAEAVRVIREKAAFDVNRIDEIEKVTNHDVIAFLTNVAENVGEESKYIHMGMTSSDVGDTALCLLMKEAAEHLLPRLTVLREKLVEKAGEYKYTPMIGRTHGIHAEPMTFGMKMLLWIAETDRNMERLQRAVETISVGKLSGAVGTYANIDPEVERRVCEKLGLQPASIATQVIQRDRHAEYMSTLAVIGCTLEKIATELRNLQRTDIREAEEYFAKGQKGSSAMPHKRNPITGERISGLARILRGNALAAMENVALWHERDISHSSVERVIVPDSTILLDYMLHLTIKIVGSLLVYPEAMMENLNKTKGLIYSQRVLLALVDKGVLRERAYELVQRNAMEVWRTKQNFADLLQNDADVVKLIPAEELHSLFDYNWFLRHVDAVFQRFGL
ncbi:adenylosuccinate lyase [Phosphitispora fastidiosa]|uniref:adenylosuccinate lyase n=1 Tax=Phosphitispora fastidiosa TaxID=2837202 RepID=UPI001E6081F6|nr:adenylosuccinate lyase [Phosphitispora fastidiosa]MBU7008520.1 adenylosuccinate lyase [Phosphitispora fastidiosa]